MKSCYRQQQQPYWAFIRNSMILLLLGAIIIVMIITWQQVLGTYPRKGAGTWVARLDPRVFSRVQEDFADTGSTQAQHNNLDMSDAARPKDRDQLEQKVEAGELRRPGTMRHKVSLQHTHIPSVHAMRQEEDATMRLQEAQDNSSALHPVLADTQFELQKGQSAKEGSLPDRVQCNCSQEQQKGVYHPNSTLTDSVQQVYKLDQLPPAQTVIPHIIHQYYHNGPSDVVSEALQSNPAFRKEWWNSCKTHHPGWFYILWDRVACEQLLEKRYPWFLDTWKLLGQDKGSIVLQSDAIRPFILHAYGGVYLDLDTECFCNMDPWLSGGQVFFMAESPDTVNNAQMASIPSHPIWLQFANIIQNKAAAGERQPLLVAGPTALTALLRNITNKPMEGLPGYYDIAIDNKIVIYGPQQWFTPCNYNEDECHVWVGDSAKVVQCGKPEYDTYTTLLLSQLHLARNKAGVLAASRKVSAENAARTASAGGAPMLHVKAVAGVHHFSGSWLSARNPNKGVTRWTEVMLSTVEFFSDSSKFIEGYCKEPRQFNFQSLDTNQSEAYTNSIGAGKRRNARAILGVHVSGLKKSAVRVPLKRRLLQLLEANQTTSQNATSSESAEESNPLMDLAYTVCWEQIQIDLTNNMCLTYLVDMAQPSATSGKSLVTERLFVLAEHLGKSGCEVHVFTQNYLKPGHVNVKSHKLAIGTLFDPFASPPAHTLSTLQVQLGHQNKQLTLLHITSIPELNSDNGSIGHASNNDNPILDVMNNLYLGESRALSKVQLLSLELPVPTSSDHHKMHAMYQHLYQELGFVGYNHKHIGCQLVASTDGGLCFLQMGFMRAYGVQ